MLANILHSPLTAGARYALAIFMSLIIFYLGLQKYAENDFFMLPWDRDYSDLLHGIIGFGHTNTAVSELPTGAVSLIAALVVLFMLVKKLASYPSSINILLFVVLLFDFLVTSTLVNIFIFSGSVAGVIYYAGAFFAGAYVFGGRVSSQLSMLGFSALVLLRLSYVGDMYLYVFWIPVLSLFYVVLRAPFESDSYAAELQDFSFGKLIGKGVE